MEKATPLDLSNPESCRTYLIEKFSDLLDGVDALYGRELMELLIARLEQTIALFHQDVQRLLAEIKVKGTTTDTSSANPLPPAAARTIANDEDEWGKHLL